MPGDIFVAKGGAVVVIGDRRIVLQQGQTARDGHPIMQGREHLFEPFRVDYELDEPEPVEVPQKNPGPGAQAPIPQDDTPPPTDAPAAKDVRAWAREQGVEVPARGALPESVVAQYVAAHQED